MLCDQLEGWDREGGREMQEGGDMGIYVYVYMIHFVIKQKLTHYCKANKDVKKKNTLRYHFTPVRMVIIKKNTNNKCRQGRGEKEMYTFGGNVNW